MATHEQFDVSLPGGRRLRVRRSAGKGRPLVLLHGLLDDCAGWEQLMERTTHPAVAIDLPGFGGSSLPHLPRIVSFAADIDHALRELGVEHAVLVGHSLGGAVAAAVAERSPSIDALVLLAPAGFGSIRLADFVMLPGVSTVTKAALPLGLINPLVVTTAYTTLVANGRLPSRDLVARLRRRAFRSGPGTVMAVEAIVAAGREPRRRMAFDGPVSVLWGERDALVPVSHARRVQHAFPQARVTVWDEMGHHPQRERPEALERYLAQILWRSRPRKAGHTAAPAPAAVSSRLRRAA